MKTWCGTTLTTVAVVRRLERGSASDTDWTGARRSRGRLLMLGCRTRTADESLTRSARAIKGAPGAEMCGDSCGSSHPRGARLLQAGAKPRQGRGAPSTTVHWTGRPRGVAYHYLQSRPTAAAWRRRGSGWQRVWRRVMAAAAADEGRVGRSVCRPDLVVRLRLGNTQFGGSS